MYSLPRPLVSLRVCMSQFSASEASSNVIPLHCGDLRRILYRILQQPLRNVSRLAATLQVQQVKYKSGRKTLCDPPGEFGSETVSTHRNNNMSLVLWRFANRMSATHSSRIQWGPCRNGVERALVLGKMTTRGSQAGVGAAARTPWANSCQIFCFIHPMLIIIHPQLRRS